MASALHFIAVLCLTSGLWTGANADCCSDDCCEPCKICPSGWTQFEDHCYMYNHAEKDWADAELACSAIGGNLASIPNKGVYDFIRQTIHTATNEHRRAWVGGSDAAKEGVWLWSDGSKFDFNGWAKGEPNNLGGEGCMEINFTGQDYVNDANCQQKSSFVCARNP